MSRTHVVLGALLCLIPGTNFGLAQGFYVGANGGYGLGAGTQSLGANEDVTGITSSYEGVFGSLGEGFKVGASAGYMFSDNIGVELGFSYWLGKSIENTYKATDLTQLITMSGSGFVAVPSIVVSADAKPINPYARFGLVLGLLTAEQEIHTVQPGQTRDATTEQKGGLAIGYAGALGVSIPLGGAVDFFAEVVLHSVTYSPSKYQITRYTINGADQLPTIPRKEYDFKDNISSTDQNVIAGVRRPFSSIGMAVGARINL